MLKLTLDYMIAGLWKNLVTVQSQVIFAAYLTIYTQSSGDIKPGGVNVVGDLLLLFKV